MTMLESPPFDTAVTDRLLATTRSVRRRLDLRERRKRREQQNPGEQKIPASQNNRLACDLHFF